MNDAAATAPAHVDGTGGFGERKGGIAQRALAWIERAGNKVPNPAILFLALCAAVIVLSQLLDWIGVSITSEVVTPTGVGVEQRLDGVSALPYDDAPEDYAVETQTFEIKGLLTGAGIRFMFTSFVPNFLGFTAVGVLLVAMIGVGVAEYSGLVGGLIRKLVAISRPATLTYIIVFVGIVSSIAADAGYLMLIPLAATAFLSVGRHPLAGLAAGFGAVSAAFSVNILIVPADAVLVDSVPLRSRRQGGRADPGLRQARRRIHRPRRGSARPARPDGGGSRGASAALAARAARVAASGSKAGGRGRRHRPDPRPRGGAPTALRRATAGAPGRGFAGGGATDDDVSGPSTHPVGPDWRDCSEGPVSGAAEAVARRDRTRCGSRCRRSGTPRRSAARGARAS
jgi:AbgT putative transporter family